MEAPNGKTFTPEQEAELKRLFYKFVKELDEEGWFDHDHAEVKK